MLFQPILALDMIFFLSWQNYSGGKTICLPPPPLLFSLGGRLPPPPRIDASAEGGGGGRGGCWRGCSPSHGRELFHFSTLKCAIWGIPIKEGNFDLTTRILINHLYGNNGIENKPMVYIYFGGAGLPPPPTHQYASGGGGALN